jgi:hypothetical protein
LDNGERVKEYRLFSDAQKADVQSRISGLKNVDLGAALMLGFQGAPESSSDSLLVVHTAPLKVELYTPEGQLQVSLNERALLHYEDSSHVGGGSDAAGGAAAAAVAEEVKDRHGGKEVVDYGEDGTTL